MAFLKTPENVRVHLVALGSTTVTYGVDWDISVGIHPGYYVVTVQYSQDGGSYALLDEYETYGLPTESCTHTTAVYNSTYTYRVTWYCRDCDSDSAFGYSNTIKSYTDTPTETITLTDEVTYSESTKGAIVTDTITLSETINIGLSDTISDTITLTDTVVSAATLKTNYAFYLADENGNAYTYSATYGSFNGSPIQSYIKLKKTDFADLYPQAGGKINSAYRAKLTYADKGVHFVTLYWSTDGGVTWESVGKDIGSSAATGKIAVSYFDFVASSEFFNWKIESSTTSGDFQWAGLEFEFVIGGEAYA